MQLFPEVGQESQAFFSWSELSFHLCLWSWTTGSCSAFFSNFCLGCGAKLPLHQLASHALPNSFPACRLTFYLNHFQILSSDKPILIPWLGTGIIKSCLFIHSYCLDLYLGKWVPLLPNREWEMQIFANLSCHKYWLLSHGLVTWIIT